MKEIRKKTESQKKERRSPSTSAPPSMSSKIIRKDSGEVLRQYPAEVGYHGSGDETKLNPEE